MIFCVDSLDFGNIWWYNTVNTVLIYPNRAWKMQILDFIKKYYNIIFSIFSAFVLCMLVAAFIFAFRSGWLPYSEDGDAFDTIYAIDQSE